MASIQEPNKASARRMVFFSLIIALNYGRSDRPTLSSIPLSPPFRSLSCCHGHPGRLRKCQPVVFSMFWWGWGRRGRLPNEFLSLLTFEKPRSPTLLIIDPLTSSQITLLFDGHPGRLSSRAGQRPVRHDCFQMFGGEKGILEKSSQIPPMQEPQFTITQRMLPHWEYDGSIYFITFNTWERLALSPRARQVVFDACLFFNNQRYDLFTLVVMPDHVHMLIQPRPKTEEDYWCLGSIMHSIKSYSAKQIPKVMPHIGTIWQPERYDRIVRDDRAFTAIWNYICQNPVKAKLANSPEHYSFLWQRSEA